MVRAAREEALPPGHRSARELTGSRQVMDADRCVSRESFTRLPAALEREWLVTNGWGGFASGTVAQANTRRYHALLVAALRPPLERHVNYAASKGGVMLMMKSIAQEVAPYRIRVNSICPGAIRTPINMRVWETPEAYAELMRLIPYKRIGEADEIGHAAVWLCSDYADYVHGGFETGG